MSCVSGEEGRAHTGAWPTSTHKHSKRKGARGFYGFVMDLSTVSNGKGSILNVIDPAIRMEHCLVRKQL